MKLPLSYYLNEDVVFLAKDLLGKILITNIGTKGVTGGIITETEAYAGAIDKASHAWGNRKTLRTSTMYQQGGIAYIYLCYGIHHLFNVVTNSKEFPHAILIRAIKPMEGVAQMIERIRPANGILPPLNGPGKLTRALGITTELNSVSLCGDTIWIEDAPEQVPSEQVIATTRIGVAYAAEHALLPYRFVWNKPDDTQ